MLFREFERKIRKLPAFNLNDVRKLDPGFHRQQLSSWQNQGYIKSFTADYYILADRQLNESAHWVMANKIYEPSYISLESALAYYQIIPETVLGVTSISARKTQQFKSDWGTFSYRTVRAELIFGYRWIDTENGWKYKIAWLEKSILDYLYLTNIQSPQDFESLRWNKLPLLALQNNPLFLQYADIYQKKILKKRITFLMEYLND